MKKWISIFLCLAILAMLPFPAKAAELPRVVDDGQLLSAEEETALTEQIRDIRDTYQMDVVILTTWDTGSKSIQAYADDYYDDHGYGYGANATGVLLLVNMGTREWYISTCGEAIYALTDYALENLGQELVYFLSSDAYYLGFENFLDSLPNYMRAYQGGSSYDGYAPPDQYEPEYGDEIVYYQPRREISFASSLLISLGIGAVAALIVVLIMRSRMNTAKFQKHAGNYLISGTYNLHQHRDLFLYSNVRKTPRQQSSSSGRGGGSSVHRSSGGRSHGGRGGRF